MTFGSSFLLQTTGRHNQSNILFRYHAPEIFSCVGEWALRGDDLRIALLERAIDIVGIDVRLHVSWLSFAFCLGSLKQSDSAVLERSDIRVPILGPEFIVFLKHAFLLGSVDSALHQSFILNFNIDSSLTPLAEGYCQLVICWLLGFELLP